MSNEDAVRGFDGGGLLCMRFERRPLPQWRVSTQQRWVACNDERRLLHNSLPQTRRGRRSGAPEHR